MPLISFCEDWVHSRSSASPWSGLTTCTTAAFCVACCLQLDEEVERTADFHVWKFIHSACSLSISTCAVSFLSGRVHPLSLLKLFFCFQSPPLPISFPFSSLYSFHLSTPMAHPHSISSLTPYSSVPCLSFTAAFCLQKTWKKCNSICSQSFSAFFFSFKYHLGGVSHTFYQTAGKQSDTLYKMLAIIQSTWGQFSLMCFFLYQLAMFHKYIRSANNYWKH